MATKPTKPDKVYKVRSFVRSGSLMYWHSTSTFKNRDRATAKFYELTRDENLSYVEIVEHVVRLRFDRDLSNGR